MKGINERRQMTEAQYNKVMRDLELLRKAEQAIASIEICTYDPLTNKPTNKIAYGRISQDRDIV